MFRVHYTLILTLLGGSAWAGVPVIEAPAMPVVELPPGAASLSADDPVMQTLLLQARCEGYRLGAELPAGRVGPGVAEVIWSAWDDRSPDRPAARRGWNLFVLPSGTSPVGLSADENATAGNNATHIARDAAGSVHMLWVDSGRPGGQTGAIYRRAATGENGRIQFETPPTELAKPGGGEWNAYPSLAARGLVVHFVWQAAGSAHYRTTWRDQAGWHWSNEVDTAAPSSGRDIGPAIEAADERIHIVTPDGFYATSPGREAPWSTERLPVPSGTRVKSASLALDRDGAVVFAISLIIHDPGALSENHGSGGYWGLRLIRRSRDGRWGELIDPLAGLPAWAPPASVSEDVLVDWTRLLIDSGGGMHLTFHGTATARVFGNDSAYYLWRGPDGVWHRPVSLQEPDVSAGFGFSYAPSLTLAGDSALPLTFYDVRSGQRDVGFDSSLTQFRSGEPVGRPLAVTRYAESAVSDGQPRSALSSRFPAASSSVYQASDGRRWLDVLETLVPAGLSGSPKLIVYQRLELTGWLVRR